MGLKVTVQRVDDIPAEGADYRLTSGERTFVDFAPEVKSARLVREARRETFSREDARDLGAKVVDDMAALHSERAVLDLSGQDFDTVGEVVLGALLAGYRFDNHRSASLKDEFVPSELRVVAAPETQSAFDRSATVAEAVGLARDLVNEPPSNMTPKIFTEIAKEVAERAGLEIRVWDESDCVREGLGGLLGVARGSVEPPRAIKLTYKPAHPSGDPVALVGKGITFDSGGLSLKSGEGMMAMKTDMGGAAAVLAAMSTLAALGASRPVSGYLMMTENLPSGSAQKPGDVLITRSKQTIEVLNTDAEGRLVLSDGLSLAVEDGAAEIVDIATLTGACVVALGDEIAGVMGNSEELVAALRRAGDAAQEPNWELPLPSRYEKHIKSEVADMKNIGKPGKAGTLSAALLLQRFVGGTKWAHLDIAGPSRADGDRGWTRQGATGFGVLTFIEWLTGRS